MKEIRKIGAIITVMLAAATSGCGIGSGIDRTCDEERFYQQARLGQRIEAPDGLDNLDPLREMPLPEASPRQPREAGQPCIDLPPSIRTDEE